MPLDYTVIGKRIAQRRRELNLTQLQVSEMADISVPYMSNIERAVSIPSTEVVMRLAIALDTTPDEFLVGAVRHQEDPESWRAIADLMRDMDEAHLALAKSYLLWLKDYKP